MTDSSERVVSVAPWLAVRGSARAVTFYQIAFAAREVYRLGEGETVVARLAVGASEFWVSEEAPEYGDSSPMTLGGSCVRMILSVPDPDAVFARALREGAVPICPVTEDHGWRVGKVRDPFGHVWEIARPPEEDTTQREHGTDRAVVVGCLGWGQEGRLACGAVEPTLAPMKTSRRWGTRRYGIHLCRERLTSHPYAMRLRTDGARLLYWRGGRGYGWATCHNK